MYGSNHGSHREEYLAIGQLNPITHDRGLNVRMIVIETNSSFRLSNGDQLQTLKVGDPTGSVNLTIRHQEAIDAFQPGDILRLRNGFLQIHRGSLHLQANRASELQRIGEFCMNYVEIPNMSEYRTEYAALERQKKGLAPEEGELTGGVTDPRRVGRGGLGIARRPGFTPQTGPSPRRGAHDPRTRPV